MSLSDAAHLVNALITKLFSDSFWHVDIIGKYYYPKLKMEKFYSTRPPHEDMLMTEQYLTGTIPLNSEKYKSSWEEILDVKVFIPLPH